MTPKTKKYLMYGGGALGVAVVLFLIKAHAVGSAPASDDSSGNSSFPDLLFTSGTGAGTALPISTTSTGDSTTTAPDTSDSGGIAAALQAALGALNSSAAAIAAQVSETYSNNATDLFSSLPQTLAQNAIQQFDATITPNADGTQTVTAKNTYIDHGPTVSFAQATDDFLAQVSRSSSGSLDAAWVQGIRDNPSTQNIQAILDYEKKINPLATVTQSTVAH